jgi:hypothetical protein
MSRLWWSDFLPGCDIVVCAAFIGVPDFVSGDFVVTGGVLTGLSATSWVCCGLLPIRCDGLRIISTVF